MATLKFKKESECHPGPFKYLAREFLIYLDMDTG
jgi:hypothetical protein